MFADESELIHRIAVALIQRRERIGTAESCTGGLIAAACTSLSGSSEWFERGVVSYSNEAKAELLGVPKGLIALHGAVSAEVAEHMARGLLAHAPIDWALSVTGIAGPTGGSVDKPVGTVWLALVHAGRPAQVWRENFGGDRQAVRLQTVRAGLTALCEALEDRDS
ncbi:CinA family protein [Roseateles saccharophilus]|uniref:Nicotinamide-nucleotide amidase n=1 Tax=Roseateles saccharophilus TaxID=304 RepID=A0A4R3VGE3_ROSSA|nr:CinA family protein [Roseateles saccharophilus]MDG0832856.1 CinA family protein [Roseateles saccharophilus]TCV04527.1 nicotinamide-nucleotide amidase [Roseateles saccharophilus]